MFVGGGDATDNEPTEEIDNVQISDVMVDIGFKYVETDLETDFTPFIQNI
jgi:hypothetical protein